MIRTFIQLLAIGLLAGCSFPKYGASITYNDRNPDPIAVVMPPNAPSITQQFWPPRNTAFDGETSGGHNGLDVWAERRTPVLAAAPGRVTSSFFDPAYGQSIVIDHGRDENGERITTRYNHLSFRDAQNGDVVARGQMIGGLGISGFLAQGIPHLHFEVVRRTRDNKVIPMDPHLFWADGVGRVTCFDPARDIPALPFRITYPVICRS